MKYLSIILLLVISLSCNDFAKHNEHPRFITESQEIQQPKLESLNKSLIYIAPETVYYESSDNIDRQISTIYIYIVNDIKHKDLINELTKIYESSTGIKTLETEDPIMADVIIDINKYHQIMSMFKNNDYINLNKAIKKDLP